MRHLRLAEFLIPGQIYHLARSGKGSGDTVALHDHDYFEVFWVEGNPCRHTINGVTEELDPGDMVFIRPRDNHEFQASKRRSWTIHNLAFPAEVWSGMRARLAGVALPSAPENAQPTRVRLSSTKRERLRQQFELMTMLPNNRLSLEWFLYGILIELQPGYTISLPADAPAWLARACRLIVIPEHFSQGPQRLASLARKSPEHVARTVRQHLGITPGEMINELRMQHARRQLEFTDESIKTIAQECGLVNLSHFFELFEKQHGVTPGRWRALRRERNPV